MSKPYLALRLAVPALVAMMPFQGAFAQNSGMPSLFELGGGMHAAVKICGGYTDAQLRDMKQQQKTQATASGMSAAAFETTFKAAYDRAHTKLSAASAAEKEKTCRQLKSMGRM